MGKKDGCGGEVVVSADRTLIYGSLAPGNDSGSGRSGPVSRENFVVIARHIGGKIPMERRRSIRIQGGPARRRPGDSFLHPRRAAADQREPGVPRTRLRESVHRRREGARDEQEIRKRRSPDPDRVRPPMVDSNLRQPHGARRLPHERRALATSLHKVECHVRPGRREQQAG